MLHNIWVLVAFLKDFVTGQLFNCVGSLLNNLMPMFVTLLWYNAVLQWCVCKSNFLLVLWLCMSMFCCIYPWYFFVKHSTSRMYIEANVSICSSLNSGLQDSHFFAPTINLITFFCSRNICTLFPLYPRIWFHILVLIENMQSTCSTTSGCSWHFLQISSCSKFYLN